MIDANYLKAHCTASSLCVKKGARGRQIGRTKGGMNTKLHAVADAKERPIGFFMSADQLSDYTGAAALLSSLPKAGWLLADRGYDADWFREASNDKEKKSAFRAGSLARRRCDTTGSATNGATASRSCSGG